jgi:hypothetical protein
VYKCEHCNYCSNRNGDLLRHLNRKYPCNKKTKEVLCKVEDKQDVPPDIIVDKKPDPVDPVDITVDKKPDPVDPVDITVATIDKTTCKSYKCPKCKKDFTRKDHMKVHEKKCDGFHKKQCKICLRMFATPQGKYQHIQYVKCNPPPPSIVPQTINNINQNQNNTTNIINNNTVNLNIRGDFDKISKSDIDNIVKQLGKSEYIKMIQHNMSKCAYAIPRTMEHIYFNEDHPNMQTLKKERRNDKMVEVHVDGKWEKRLIDDIMKKVVTIVEEYHQQYFKHLEEKFKGIPIGSKEWNISVRPLKTFGHMMVWYDGFSGKGIENIGIPLNRPEEDRDREVRAKNKDLKRIIKEKIYELTPNSTVLTV